MRNADRPPSGCQHCGLGERLHFQRWSSDVGWHGFAPPTKEKIAERMRLRYPPKLKGRDRVAPDADGAQ